MGTIVYNLILVTSGTFVGGYNSLDNCNKAIRSIYEKRFIPIPENLSKESISAVQEVIDTTVKYQREYVCIKAS